MPFDTSDSSAGSGRQKGPSFGILGACSLDVRLVFRFVFAMATRRVENWAGWYEVKSKRAKNQFDDLVWRNKPLTHVSVAGRV